MSNPYQGLSPTQFWSSSVAGPAPGHIDPTSRAAKIEAHHRVATMGSCFAQHISRTLAASGINFLSTEPAPPELTPAQASARGYGMFSARYGNVYTVRQAVQLFDRAFGQFTPIEQVWKKGERFVDPFRPQIEPEGFASAAEVLEAASLHLKAVREMFTQADWLVFTLGLTEGWRCKKDGAVYPLAPGVAGGAFSAEEHEFVNFTAAQVRDDILALAARMAQLNRDAKIILTVSPVPLIATYEKRHVLQSNTYSKAALRVAADEAERALRNVIYFPSYEIITSPAAEGRYYADDLRQVTEQGVKHVMRVFGRHFLPSRDVAVPREEAVGTSVASPVVADVVCDEETIERALRESGFEGGRAG